MNHFKKVCTTFVATLLLASSVSAQLVCTSVNSAAWRSSLFNQSHRGTATQTWVMNEYIRQYVFRGQTFQCSGTLTCSYAWGRSQSTAVTWNVSVQAGLAGNWSNLLALIGASYGYTYTTTTTFNWTVNLAPGQFAYPAQYVNRQRIGGQIFGGWRRAGNCNYNRAGGTYYRKVASTTVVDVWQSQQIRARQTDNSKQAIGVYIINGRE